MEISPELCHHRKIKPLDSEVETSKEKTEVLLDQDYKYCKQLYHVVEFQINKTNLL